MAGGCTLPDAIFFYELVFRPFSFTRFSIAEKKRKAAWEPGTCKWCRLENWAVCFT
jgi:hypothetical protein